MRDHLATLLDDFRRYPREVAVVRYQGNRRRVTTYGEIAHLAGAKSPQGLQQGELVRLIREAGFEALERDNLYNVYASV